jgi:hypothetical protein
MTTTTAPIEQINRPGTVPERNGNELTDKPQGITSSTKVPSSSLWDEYISQRQSTNENIQNSNNEQPKHQIGSVQPTSSTSSSTSPTPIESVMPTTPSLDSNTSMYNNPVLTTLTNNGPSVDYDEKNDPEPLKFNFMGNKAMTITDPNPVQMGKPAIADPTPVPETKAETTTIINDPISLSNESFLKAITTVETIATTTNLPAKAADMENFETESIQDETSPTNPLQTFWERNMSTLKNLGKSKEVDNRSPIVSVELPPPKPYIDTRGMTERIMKKIDNANLQSTATAGGAGGSTTYAAFLKVEENWTKLKQQSSNQPATTTSPNRKSMSMAPFVTSDAALGNPKCWTKLREQAALASTTSTPIQLDYDIVICGGTLGIFFALALLLRNPKFRICVVESAPAIRGRDQEWNISLSELYELVKLGVLKESDLDDIITTEFPACRSGFKVSFLRKISVMTKNANAHNSEFFFVKPSEQ